MSQPGHSDDDHPAPEVPADALMSVLGEQVATLYDIAQELETSLSDTLSAADELSADAFRTIQRIDYMRQSLKDIGAILSFAGPDMQWQSDKAIRIDTLHDIVDMRDSLGALHHRREDAPQCHDIWL